MELGQVDSTTSLDQTTSKKNRSKGCLFAFVAILVLAGGIWLLVRPGVFTIQPIGALPDGITIVYHSRGPQMPFFASPDGLCLEIQGSVTLLCRLAAMGAVDEIADRILIRLPYSELAYLVSTGGATFDR